MTTNQTLAEVRAIAERAKKATEGWTVSSRGVLRVVDASDNSVATFCANDRNYDREALERQQTANMEFAVHARTDVPRLCAIVEELAAEVERLRAGWQPIETAPKDGTPILLWIPDTELPWPGHAQDDGRLFSNAHGPLNEESYGRVLTCTHWMPLPPAPKGGEA